MYDFKSDSSIKNCPVCGHERIKTNGINRNLTYDIECARCGKFVIDQDCFELKDVEYKIKSNSAKISGYIRLQNEVNKSQSVIITSKKVDEILSDPTLPKNNDIEKKAKFLLEGLKRKPQHFGKSIELLSEVEYPLAFAEDVEEFNALLIFLEESGFLKFIGEPHDSSVIELTPKGWKYFQDNSERSKSKNVFIAAWFDDSMDESVKAICEIVEKHKFNPICIKYEVFKERIMDKALGEIKSSKFVIIDLTNHRPAVLFEAGFAQALGIDMIFVHKKDSGDSVSSGFYTSHYQIHEYSNMEELKKKLNDVIKVRIT